jgi:hypothetical protein
MKTLLISLLLSLTQAHAASPAQDHYDYLKGTEYRVDYSHRYGSGLQRFVLEKSSRNEICQKVANGRPAIEFTHTCYVVSDVGTTAQSSYENDSRNEELSVAILAVDGQRRLLEGRITEKQNDQGFCRKTVSENSDRAYYLCYQLAR